VSQGGLNLELALSAELGGRRRRRREGEEGG